MKKEKKISQDNKDRGCSFAAIARLSGVSKQVVSAILNGGNTSSRFSQATMDKVKKIAKKLNYRPNITSRNLVNGRHGCITILFKNFYRIPFNFPNFLIRRAETYGQVISFELLREKLYPRCVNEDRTDGILLFEDINEKILRRIRKYSIPHVFVNCNQRMCENCITFDEEDLIKKVLQYFADEGKKHPIFLIGNLDYYWNLERKNTALSSYRQFGFNEIKIIETFRYPTPQQELFKIISGSKLYDSLFIGEDFGNYQLIAEKFQLERDARIAYVMASFLPGPNNFLECSIHQVEVPEYTIDMLNKIINGKSPGGPIKMKYNMRLINRG